MATTDVVLPDGPGVARDAVRAQLAELSREAATFSLNDLRCGNWFPQLLRHALERYRSTVDAEYFEKKYPGLDRDAVVDRRIDLAKQYAAISGGISATGYSVAVVATLRAQGGASPLRVPVGVASFAADLFFLTQLQLRVAYDLGVLYGYRLDLEDPEDLVLLIRLACGAKAGEALQNAALKLAPEVVRQGDRRAAPGDLMLLMKSLPVVGTHLLQRNIVKVAIPGVAIPLSSAVNYFTTGRIAATARQVFRDRAFLEEAAPGLVDGLDSMGTLLLLRVVTLVVHSDGQVSAPEAMLLDGVMGALEEAADPLALEELRRTIDRDGEAILEQLGNAPPDLRSHIYEAACLATAMDRRVKRREEKQLRRIAAACELEYDRQHVKRLIERISG